MEARVVQVRCLRHEAAELSLVWCKTVIQLTASGVTGMSGVLVTSAAARRSAFGTLCPCQHVAVLPVNLELVRRPPIALESVMSPHTAHLGNGAIGAHALQIVAMGCVAASATCMLHP